MNIVINVNSNENSNNDNFESVDNQNDAIMADDEINDDEMNEDEDVNGDKENNNDENNEDVNNGMDNDEVDDDEVNDDEVDDDEVNDDVVNDVQNGNLNEKIEFLDDEIEVIVEVVKETELYSYDEEKASMIQKFLDDYDSKNKK